MRRTLLLLVLFACRPALAHPVTFPSFAVQCVRLRPVVCTMDAPTCAWLVGPAVRRVNALVGRAVFEYQGVISEKGAQAAYESGVYVIGYGKLPQNVLGVTIPNVQIVQQQPCIIRVLTALDRKQAFDGLEPRRVLEHEMVHALGFDHAPSRSFYISPMGPAYNPTAEWGPADIATIRAVYGD